MDKTMDKKNPVRGQRCPMCGSNMWHHVWGGKRCANKQCNYYKQEDRQVEIGGEAFDIVPHKIPFIAPQEGGSDGNTTTVL